MLGVLVFCHLTALGGVISGMSNCPGVLNKVMGKRLPISWPRIEKNIGFQMCLRKCEAMSYCLSINFNRVLLECELNDRKKNDTNDLVDDGNYFYAETVRTDHHSNLCGEEICNNYSTCITMPGNKKVCIETDCSESAPGIPNGKIVQRTYSPDVVTYRCNGSIQTTCCPAGGKWASLDYRCEWQTTRLVGSNVSFEGRVEVYLNGSWGTVCDDGFGMADANVVCSSLGYPGALQVRPSAAFGIGSGQILMDNVACLSSEISILECAYVDSNSQNCGHYEDIGVICEH
nr:deleted in malignant brain tumors 1 protein-like [Crassostrea gigas]